MKWIKASKRLPQFEEILFVKIDGIKKMGNFYNDNGSIYFHVTGTHQWEIPQERFNGIRWLDEQHEGWVPVAKVKSMIVNTWQEAQLSFSKEIGGDMSGCEEDGPIANTLGEYLDRIFPPATKD